MKKGDYMRKLFVMLLIAIVGSFLVGFSIANAAKFTPTQMKLSAPYLNHYGFDNSKLQIPVKVSGVGGQGVLMVYTKDKGESIGKVRNGHLGWHFVNMIDTCIYVSSPQTLGLGANTVEWNGKSTGGSAVPAGEYYYYVWAYDHVSNKTVVSRKTWWSGWVAPDIMVTKDELGNPLPAPIYMQSGSNCCDDAEAPHTATHGRFTIGGDPDDATLVETSTVQAWRDNCRIDVLPTDHTMWFKGNEKPNGVFYVSKYKWVPNGASVIQTAWGTGGTVEWTLPAKYTEFHFSVVIPEGSDNLLFPNMNHQTTQPISELVYLDLADGSYVQKVDLSDWWINVDEGAKGGFVSGGPTDLYPDKQGGLSLNTHGTCLVHLMDPARDGDINDKTLYVNGNGDTFLDTNWQADAVRPWVCNDPFVAVYKYALDVDSNRFSIVNAYDIGAISFGLVGPDGTGAGYFSFAGETTAWIRGTMYAIDYGSAYDGLYTDNQSSDADKVGLWYVANDSIKGVITNQVAVEDAPAAFSVAQNTPNPFNPTTTISFNLAKAGDVTVDVFNVAGQKVATIANEFMSVGGHSVTWNADSFSAGVYFYTVKNGNFSKTMKMTLLK